MFAAKKSKLTNTNWWCRRCVYASAHHDCLFRGIRRTYVYVYTKLTEREIQDSRSRYLVSISIRRVHQTEMCVPICTTQSALSNEFIYLYVFLRFGRSIDRTIRICHDIVRWTHFPLVSPFKWFYYFRTCYQIGRGIASTLNFVSPSNFECWGIVALLRQIDEHIPIFILFHLNWEHNIIIPTLRLWECA